MNPATQQIVLTAAASASTVLVSIVAWFTVRLINKIELRLDQHDSRITSVEQHVAVLRDRGQR